MVQDSAFRAIFLICFLSSIAISGFYRRRARASGGVIARRAEGTAPFLVRMGMAFLLAGSFLVYVFLPGWLSGSELKLPLWLRWAAALIAVLCLPVIRWVLVSIGDNITETILAKPTHQLVTRGPYRWIRHPLYAAALLELFALAVLASSWFLLLFPLIGLVVFRWLVIPREEANLIKVFGQQYTAYQQHSGALFPRLPGRKE